MTGRRHIASAFIVAALMLLRIRVGNSRLRAISPPRDVEPSSDAERALAAQHPREWANLTPDQRRARARELSAMASDAARGTASACSRTSRRSAICRPNERKRVLEGLRKWRQLPQARRDELQHDYARWRGLPPDQRDRVMKRYQQFEQLPPAQRERMMANWHRWQQMTPEQRREARRRLGLWRHANIRTPGPGTSP